MKHLSSKLVKKMKSSHYPATLKLDLFTLCSLIQARIETPLSQEKFFEVNKEAKMAYIKVCIDCLGKYYDQIGSYSDDKISLYFQMVCDDFKAFYKCELKSVASEYYDNFAKVSDIYRTGWVNLKIPSEDCETVTEHMYNTWLIGMLYLPKETDKSNYDKEKILKMILIHDLAESVTGDIPSPIKSKNNQYDEVEKIIMKKLLLKGTYVRIENLDDYYQIWEEFVKGDTINARIAKELDKIQLLYQFCKYYKRYPEKFTEEVKQDWIGVRTIIKTQVGQEIYKLLVEDNIEFKDIFNSEFSRHLI